MSKQDKKKNLINNEIRAQFILLLLDDGSRVKLSLYDAIYKARNASLDLVQLGGNSDLPACKIMDYNKFKYEEMKKNKSKVSTKIELKEVQIRPAICENDLNVKKKRILEFLDKGYDIRLRLQLRGREKASFIEHCGFLKECALSFQDKAKIELREDKNKAIIGGIITLKSIKKTPI